jgi:hypothetical protein
MKRDLLRRAGGRDREGGRGGRGQRQDRQTEMRGGGEYLSEQAGVPLPHRHHCVRLGPAGKLSLFLSPHSSRPRPPPPLHDSSNHSLSFYSLTRPAPVPPKSLTRPFTSSPPHTLTSHFLARSPTLHARPSPSPPSPLLLRLDPSTRYPGGGRERDAERRRRPQPIRKELGSSFPSGSQAAPPRHANMLKGDAMTLRRRNKGVSPCCAAALACSCPAQSSPAGPSTVRRSLDTAAAGAVAVAAAAGTGRRGAHRGAKRGWRRRWSMGTARQPMLGTDPQSRPAKRRSPAAGRTGARRLSGVCGGATVVTPAAAAAAAVAAAAAAAASAVGKAVLMLVCAEEVNGWRFGTRSFEADKTRRSRRSWKRQCGCEERRAVARRRRPNSGLRSVKSAKARDSSSSVGPAVFTEA